MLLKLTELGQPKVQLKKNIHTQRVVTAQSIAMLDVVPHPHTSLFWKPKIYYIDMNDNNRYDGKY